MSSQPFLFSAQELDQALSFVDESASAHGDAPHLTTDPAELRALFAQLASHHVAQVRDFVTALRRGEGTVEWVGICRPALLSLRSAANKLDLAEVCKKLDGFCEELLAFEETGRPTIDGAARDRLLDQYDDLSASLPGAFAFDPRAAEGEAFILQALLLQIPGITKATTHKLYAAGLTNLRSFLTAEAHDVAATTGIDLVLASRLVDHFRAYRDHAAPLFTRADVCREIAPLVTLLRRRQSEFESVAQAWSREADAKKRELRGARTQTLLEIQVVLARLGEVELLNDIERLPFEGKLVRLESFLASKSLPSSMHVLAASVSAPSKKRPVAPAAPAAIVEEGAAAPEPPRSDSPITLAPPPPRQSSRAPASRRAPSSPAPLPRRWAELRVAAASMAAGSAIALAVLGLGNTTAGPQERFGAAAARTGATTGAASSQPAETAKGAPLEPGARSKGDRSDPQPTASAPAPTASPSGASAQTEVEATPAPPPARPPTLTHPLRPRTTKPLSPATAKGNASKS
jgi:hypothetical protein